MSKSTVMQVNDLKCEMNVTTPLKSIFNDKGEEITHGLPPHGRTYVYPVDEYPACPTNWMHGSDKASSYFCAVESGKGMWLDFNGNANDEYEIAVVISVQGINPITGQKTTEMRLEQYASKCPLHDVEFQQDRFCPKCKYKWPAQNYMATTGTRRGLFWLDGFRSAEGVIRQYIISEEEARGVASNKIGKDRVFAIGIAFYRSKDKKPKPVYSGFTRGVTKSCSTYGGTQVMGYCPPSSPAQYDEPTLDACLDSFEMGDSGPAGAAGGAWACAEPPASEEKVIVKGTPSGQSLGGGTLKARLQAKFGAKKGSVKYSADEVKCISTSSSSNEASQSSSKRVAKTVDPVTPKTFEIAAGARIDQEIAPDPKSLDYWEEAPAGMIYINYTDQETVTKILEAGKREELEEGMLTDVPVGNK